MITDCYEHEYNDLCVFRLPTQFRYILKPYQKKKLYIYIYIYIYVCVCVCVLGPIVKICILILCQI